MSTKYNNNNQPNIRSQSARHRTDIRCNSEQSGAPESSDMTFIKQYRESGFATVRGVFNAAEVAEMAAEADRMQVRGLQYRATFRHQNILYVIQEDPQTGRVLRFMQWPAYVSPVLQRYRTDQRMLDILSPLIGPDLKQIINQLIWKQPRSECSSYAYHQDHRFRRPASAYRELASSFVQTAIAIDAHTADNGCITLFKGSHKLGDLELELEDSVYKGACSMEKALARGLDEKDLVEVLLEPGDIALWNPYTVHGSGQNRSTGNRRTYLNGYVTANNCDRGEWAFRNGMPCELGEPVLVQYEDLVNRPEPHYVDGSPHPFRS